MSVAEQFLSMTYEHACEITEALAEALETRLAQQDPDFEHPDWHLVDAAFEAQAVLRRQLHRAEQHSLVIALLEAGESQGALEVLRGC